MGAENLTPTGIGSGNRPARSESLYRLSYPGPPEDSIIITIIIIIIMSALANSEQPRHLTVDHNTKRTET